MNRSIQKWEGVKFDNFPLNLWRKRKNSYIYAFGGRYFTLTGFWAGVEYNGRFMFYTPKWKPEEIIQHIWILIEAQEDAPVKMKRHYKLQLADDIPIKFHARFIGGHFKTTLSGYGRDRRYGQKIMNSQQIVVCATENRSRSGRYWNWAQLILVPVEAGPIEVEEWGVF